MMRKLPSAGGWQMQAARPWKWNHVLTPGSKWLEPKCLQRHPAISILFLIQKCRPGKLLRTFRESFSTFSSSRKCFRRSEHISKFSWHRRDSIGPKIIKFRAILAIFRPFEISKNVPGLRVYLNLQGRYKTESMCLTWTWSRWHNTKMNVSNKQSKKSLRQSWEDEDVKQNSGRK